MIQIKSSMEALLDYFQDIYEKWKLKKMSWNLQSHFKIFIFMSFIDRQDFYRKDAYWSDELS